MTRGVQTDMVDGLVSSTAVKGPCFVATTANVALAGLQTIDGELLTDGKRVLVVANTDQRENGIWIASAGNWRRARDFASNNDIREGTQVRVTDGATRAGVWVLTTSDPIVLDTSNIVFARDNTLTDGALLKSNNLADLASAIAAWDNLVQWPISGVSPVAGVLDLTAATAVPVSIDTGPISSVVMGGRAVRLVRFVTDTTVTCSAALTVNNQASLDYIIPAGTFAIIQAINGATIVRIFTLGGWSKGRAVASAANIVLTPGATHHVSGNTGITDVDFGPATDGASAWVVFDSTPTLTHSANLALPGAANIVAAAGDRALFVQDVGDAVICLAYQRAGASPLPAGILAGDVFYASANGVMARLAKGTAKQKLRMNTGATAPEWGSEWETIGATSGAGVAAITFTDLSAYRSLRLLWVARPATDSVTFGLQVSTDNGSSWLSSSGDYHLQDQDAAGTAFAALRVTTNTAAQIGGLIGNAAGEGAAGRVEIMNFNQAAKALLTAQAANLNPTTQVTQVNDANVMTGTTARNALRVLFSSGNIADGYVVLEGMRG